MIPAIIACKVNRDANGHERTSSFRIAISAMPLKRTWIMSRSMSASGQEQAIRSVRIPAHGTVVLSSLKMVAHASRAHRDHDVANPAGSFASANYF